MKLIKGKDLTIEQRELIHFIGASDDRWVEKHAFYFENGLPSNVAGFYYPVINPSDDFINSFNKIKR